MIALTFTDREARTVRDALVHLAAYTAREQQEHLGWDSRDRAAWSSALAKTAAEVGDERTDEEANR